MAVDGAAAQAPAAVGAAEVGAEHIGAGGARVAVGVGAVAGAFVVGGDLGGLGVLLQGDDGRVGGLWGPDPLVGWAAVVAGVFAVGAAVPDHVAGVFGVGEQVGAGDVGVWRWVAIEVLVEPLGDGVVAELLVDAPGEDLRDHRRAGGVKDQTSLGLAFAAFGGYGVLDALGEVAVGWMADVPALAGVGLQAVAGGLQQLQRVPLGHPLLHAAGQDLGGVFAAVGLVGGQQDDACALDFVFDLGAEVGDAGHPVDGLAGDGVEGAVRAGGLGEQLTDTAVAAHGDVEQFVGVAEAALVELGAAGLDVVEAAGDGRAGRQVVLDAVELAGDGEGRVLLLHSGGASQERDTDRDRALVVEGRLAGAVRRRGSAVGCCCLSAVGMSS